MGKNKLQRFAEVERFENVLQLTDFQDEGTPKPAGEWKSGIFKNDAPVILELACGKGEYTLELARRNPECNFVGVDIKGARIWKGAKKALKEDLDNIRFLRIYIDHLHEYFAPEEVDEIWITFPDPFLKYSKRNKRLSSPKFLNIYRQVVKKGGPIHFKTDSDTLFAYTCNMLERQNCTVLDREDDVYTNRPDDELLTIQTYFEKKHLIRNRTIKYLQFALPNLSRPGDG